MARPRRATEVNDSEGTYSRNPKRRNDREPRLPKGLPEPPLSVRKDNVALKKYKEVGGYLVSMNVLSPYYVDLLSEYALTFSMYSATLANIQAEGMVTKDRFGQDRRNPRMPDLYKLLDALRKMQSEFGLTPSGKAALQVEAPETKGKDDFIR